MMFGMTVSRTTDEVQISLKPLARSYGLSQEDLAREIRATLLWLGGNTCTA